MTSLSEAYRRRGGANPRRLALGLALFLSGAALVVGAIVVATTAFPPDMRVSEARELAGVLAGIGFPAALLGVFAVLPAHRHVRATAVIGASVTVLGVALFRWAYPCRWVGSHCGATNLTLPVIAVYFLGAVTVLWALFSAIAAVKRRSDPGGTVELEMTEGGARIISVSGESLRQRLGGVGFLGGTPDGGVRTRTATADIAPPESGGGEILDEDTDDPAAATPAADPYCGNCAHFSYVRVDGELQPYCGLDEALMDDIEACERWEPNTTGISDRL